MLVCNVSLRPARTAISAEIIEAATAASATTAAGDVLVLVDESVSAIDTVHAYLGEIMLEAASADDSVTVVGGAVAAAIDETAAASDLVTVESGYAVAVAETATAADAPDATVTAAALTRSAMLTGPVFINTGASREANINGVMVNI